MIEQCRRVAATPPAAAVSGNRVTDERLFQRHVARGDPYARDALVERFLPLARDLATRYSHGDEPLDDLVQVASIGLLKAIDRYDPTRGTKFTSYAVPTILGELKRYFRDCGWALRVPRDLQERALAAKRTVEALSAELGRSPTSSETAAAFGSAREDVLEALEVAASYRVVSLDAPSDHDSGRGAGLVELLGTDDATYELVEEREAIARGWHELPELERNVLHLRFFHDLSQREIGERVGYSQMHVSRLVRRALARLERAVTTSEAAA
jgi:RNA polymerase sigma-B factor